MKVAFAQLVVITLFFGSTAFAHELNPKVIEKLTGEVITYDDHTHDEEVEETVADPRDESRTFYSFPEWYIVYSAQEYGDFVSKGNRPSQFPYFAAIGQMWDSWKYAEQAATIPPDATTNTILWTISISFTVEYALIGIYENTIGPLSEWLHFDQKTVEDRYVDAQAVAYGEFLNQTPWYEFPYGKALIGLWQTYGWSSLSPRGIERRLAFTMGYGAKAAYAAVIRKLSETNFEGGAGQTTTVTLSSSKSVLDALGLPYLTASSSRYEIALPRYRAFRDPVVALAQSGANFELIEGHEKITFSVLAPLDSSCEEVEAHHAFVLPLVTDEQMARYVLSVPVADLGDSIRALDSYNLEVEHIYDY